MRELTDLEQRILAFEKQWWRRRGAKDATIYTEFELSVTYYLRLHQLLDNPAALLAQPSLIKRLREARATQLRLRDPRYGAASVVSIRIEQQASS